MMQLDAFPPFQRHSAPSFLAAEAVRPTRATGQALVLKLLRLHKGGLSDEQMQESLAMNPSTQRPRRIELVEQGLVRDSNIRAKTRSGRFATLWVAV